MKAMKGINVNKMLGSLKRRPNETLVMAGAEDDTPEATAARNVKLFCESGGPNEGGDEVLYLPAVVESCESSPSAAKEAAHLIRKFLCRDNYSRPYVQYNSIMLIRILADNPGRTFTRNFDAKFVQTVKELLRTGRDPSVNQILIETLGSFQREKADDEGLVILIDMWKKENEKMISLQQAAQAGSRIMNAPPLNANPQSYFSRNHTNRSLPPPHELSSRIQEARTSAGLLSQVVQSTSTSEVLTSELVREFADRCQSASRSIQAYMIADNPSPDNDTMETLIDTSEKLGKALNQHQRAVLHARKSLGLGNAEAVAQKSQGSTRTDSGYPAPPGPPSLSNKPRAGKEALPADKATTESNEINPFSDPIDRNAPFPKDEPYKLTGQFNDRLGIEPYHPGFQASDTNKQDTVVERTSVPATTMEETGEERYGVEPRAKAPVYRY